MHFRRLTPGKESPPRSEKSRRKRADAEEIQSAEDHNAGRGAVAPMACIVIVQSISAGHVLAKPWDIKEVFTIFKNI